jgi:predicted nucleic acid-binding protein
MMSSMTSERLKDRITITVDPAVLEAVRAVVDTGEASSVSAFFERAALLVLDADLAFERMVDDALAASGGPLTPDEVEAADRLLGHIP